MFVDDSAIEKKLSILNVVDRVTIKILKTGGCSIVFAFPGRFELSAPEEYILCIHMKNSSPGKRSPLKTLFKIFLIIAGIILLSLYPAYLISRYAVNRYLTSWGTKLVDLEKRGLLSREFGAGWQDVLTGVSMDNEARRITASDTAESGNAVTMVDGIVLKDYPSLSIIDRLGEIREYSNSIEITDRRDRRLAVIKTDHQRGRIGEFPPTLVNAIIAAEDKTFRSSPLGFSFDSFLRAALRAGLKSVLTLHRAPMRGTSTITQQVAKLFISRLDATGGRHVSRSLDRKLRELRLAAALRMCYSSDAIMEVYLNHCVTSDYGMIGYKDIAAGLFNKKPLELSDAQCVYLSRMVKWGRNVPKKITAQCRVDMPRIAAALGWDANKQKQVLQAIDSLTFSQPKRVDAVYGSFVDLANEFWLLTLRRNGLSGEQLSAMDLIDPSSLIRKKGNLKISLTIDSALQHELETLVRARGYGPDTTIYSDFTIASEKQTLKDLAARPRDTLRKPAALREGIDFREPGAAVITSLNPGDTVLLTITYKKAGKDSWRREKSVIYRKPVVVDGQYYAYGIMDSKTGKLLAYYSKDRLGSRLACLLRNRTPNGSSTTKPIMNALNFDLGTFQPYTRWSDSVEIIEDVPWKRTFERNAAGRVTGAVFAHSATRGKPYVVHNHLGVIEGCQHVFDLLATSNNILGTETLYRLNRKLFEANGETAPGAFPLVQYYYRIGALSRIKDSLRLTTTTGVRAYKELVRVAGADPDSVIAFGKHLPLPDEQYSVALGTFELSLYEQMHIYNILYNNDLIERPADHPSLVIQSIVLNGDTVAMTDTIRRFHPFSDLNNIRPTLLGMHKRLTSSGYDGLADFDIPLPKDSLSPDSIYTDGKFHAEAYLLDAPPSNFAKSGTTDDVIKPFNVPPSSKLRTNYGIWNAVIRVDLARLGTTGDSAKEITDLTVASIGECNAKYTGYRDGKTLHKFLTMGLLKKAGVRSPNGFYRHYEDYLRKVTPPGENCGKEAVAGSEAPAAAPVIEGKGD
jgi:hypothetical protein